jgi:hypothetical protein
MLSRPILIACGFSRMGAALCLAACVSCSEAGGEQFVRASGVRIGASEADTIREAGAPTRVANPPRPSCINVGGQRELIYELRVVRLWGALSDVVSSQVMLCIGKDSTVIDRSTVSF